MKIPALLARSELGRSIWTFRREFVWVGVFSFFSNLLMLAPTLYMLQVFDRVMLSQNEFTLISLTLIVTLFFAVMGFAEWVRSRLLVRAGVRFDEFLNSRVFKSSFDANLNLMASNPVQSFSDLTNLRQFLTGNGIFALFDTPWTPIYMAVLFMMHPWLGLVSVVFTAILGFLAWYSHKLTAAGSVQANEAVVKSNGYLQGKLVHVETVVSLGMLANLRRHWLMLYSDQLDKSLDAQHLQHQVQAFVKFVQYTQQSLVLALGALLAIRGDISAGAMVASNALVSNALRPIGTLVSTWRQFADAQASYLRLEKLMKEHPDRGAVHVAEVVHGRVTLHDLVASAPGRARPILKGLSVNFNAGEVVAIVGPSGAGKSTLARCIIGIWPDVQGQVLLDGHDINAWSRDDLGPHLGYLPQDIELFEGTIAENIGRFGDLKSEWVIDAAQRTGIHDMILRFPKGYDTPMGVAGGMLSGGQRQRVGLARAIYGNPALVVLDEPNANLDDVGETALIRTVQDLRQQGKTVFMVVHQRNLLSVADRVLVLNDGVITQFGQLAVQPPAVTTSSEPSAQTRTA
ncbi:type I secretion system permease/ATPase [Limnohabitans sp.]|uniref:type I secretion system permease/ATPase n=1 Tax=Limnohabitans sp. TaxID=1907725 RepID=UPI00286F2BA8|nr:type I secretion system permease/ATPase [Limnohabitans sp.]